MCAFLFTAAVASWCFSVEPAPEVPRNEFTMEQVVERARSLAGEKYNNPDAVVADKLCSIPKDQWDKIVYRPESLIWKDGGLPFAVGFHHPGSIYNRIAAFNIVEDGVATPIRFSPENFAYPNADLREHAAEAKGYAGFFLRVQTDEIDGDDRDDGDLASFLGATFFQSKGRHSRFGVYARGVAVDTGLASGEEFPYFREFWIVKPLPDDASITVYALMDSPRITGAYHFVITPGTSTVMEVEARVFLRAGADAPGKIGLAPMTSMFLHSETHGAAGGDYRPEVHNSDGLLFATSDDQWHWSPLANPDKLVDNCFPLDNPKGFGLMQRDDNFDHYQDLDARFDRRPSLWVEPVGEWGPGHIELVEIPGAADYHENIVAFWVPNPPAPDGDAPKDPGAPRAELSYRLHWLTSGYTPHDLGRVVATRARKNLQDKTLRFVIDFEGERLNAFHADTGLVSIVAVPEPFAIAEKRLLKNEATSGWRLMLTVRLPQEPGILDSLFASREGVGGARFTALLKLGENLPDPLTETWVFDLQP